MTHTWGYQDNQPPGAQLLSGTMYVWLEPEAQGGRVVFYDWDNDEGLSLNLDEWRLALEWWAAWTGPNPHWPRPGASQA